MNHLISKIDFGVLGDLYTALKVGRILFVFVLCVHTSIEDFFSVINSYLLKRVPVVFLSVIESKLSSLCGKSCS